MARPIISWSAPDRSTRLGRMLERWRWFVPGMGVKRYALLIAFGLTILLIGFFQFARIGPWRAFFSEVIGQIGALIPGRWPLWMTGALLFAFGVMVVGAGIGGLNRSILRAIGAQPLETLDMIYARRALSRGQRIVAIGGGTGLSNLLSGLKRYSSNLTAIVAVTDDGGSTGRLRAALGMPAPGDLTDCYAALSDSPLLSSLLTHRFTRGEGLEGHTFGNLLLATLSEERGDFAEATLAVNAILQVRGQVIPATSAAAVLVAELEDGTRVIGESKLRDRPEGVRIERLRLEPAALPAMPQAIDAIRNAELVVIGPGSLYSSVIPPLLVPEVGAAIRATPAKIIYIVNIMTEAGETDGMSALDHVRALQAHLGRVPDIVLVNTAPISQEMLERYRAERAEPSRVEPAAFRAAGIRAHGAILTRSGGGQHDPDELSAALVRLFPTRRRLEISDDSRA
jgi:uncharacterized cofD-like protein